MSTKINDLEYLGSINLARIFEEPDAIVARGLNAAYDLNGLWFEPKLPSGSPGMITVLRPGDLRASCEAYGGTVVDVDLKGPAIGPPWYVIAVERSEHFGHSVSIYIPEDAPPEGVAAVRAAWEASQ
jgi:hypothetical protein